MTPLEWYYVGLAWWIEAINECWRIEPPKAFKRKDD